MAQTRGKHSREITHFFTSAKRYHDEFEDGESGDGQSSDSETELEIEDETVETAVHDVSH